MGADKKKRQCRFSGVATLLSILPMDREAAPPENLNQIRVGGCSPE